MRTVVAFTSVRLEATGGHDGTQRTMHRSRPGPGRLGFVHTTISADLDATAARVAAFLRDLGNYPGWLDIVRRAEPDNPPGDAHDPGPAWMVTLRARVGPLARSKRLRMVRTVDEPHHLRFERRELDGRSHAAWVLDVRLDGDSPCATQVDLRYEGRLWTAPLEAVLGSQISDAIPRLRALVAG